jgi:hypothetical protein
MNWGLRDIVTLLTIILGVLVILTVRRASAHKQ